MTDLYAFMGEANTILDMKVHGEVPEEAPEDVYAEREQVRGVMREEISGKSALRKQSFYSLRG